MTNLKIILNINPIIIALVYLYFNIKVIIESFWEDSMKFSSN